MAYNADEDRKKWERLHNEMEFSGKSIKYPEADPKDGRPLGAEVMQPALKDTSYKVDDRQLIGNTDAKIWAEEFVKLVKHNPSVPLDESCMLGWFANAIMAGYDKAREVYEKKPLDVKQELLNKKYVEVEDVKY